MSTSAEADKDGRKVFLGGLAYETNADDIKKDFGKYGDLEDVQLPIGDGGKHKGFAFLTYRSTDDANYACKEHHQREYMGREISAKIVVPREQRGGDERPGDWTCPGCGANVFGSKSACFRCGEPKGNGGGGGGGGRGDRGGDRGGGDRGRYDDRDDRGRGGGRDDRRGDDRRGDDRDDRRGDDRDDRRGGGRDYDRRDDDRGRGGGRDDRRGDDRRDNDRRDDRSDRRRSHSRGRD